MKLYGNKRIYVKEFIKYLLDCERTTDNKTIDTCTDVIMNLINESEKDAYEEAIKIINSTT